MLLNRTLRVVTDVTAEPLDLIEAKNHLRVDFTDDDALIKRLISVARRRTEEALRRRLLTQTWLLTLDLYPLHVERFPRGEMFELPFPPLQALNSIQYVDVNGVTQTLDPATYQVDRESEPARVMPAYMQIWQPIRYVPNAIQVSYTCGYMTPMTAVANSAALTARNHTLQAGDQVRLYNSGGALPAGLAENTDYFVVNPASPSLGLAATPGGAAIAPTDAGTGSHYVGKRVIPEEVRQAMLLLISHLYQNRDAVITDARVASIEVPMAYEYLLESYKITRF